MKIESCAIVTMPANKLMAEIHNVKHRMPAILARENRAAWLAGDHDVAFNVLRPYPDAAHGCRAGEHSRQQAGE